MRHSQHASIDVSCHCHHISSTGTASRIKLFEAEMAANDRASALLIPHSERLDSPFNINIAPGRRVTLPPGSSYDFLRYQVNWRTSNRRPVAFEGRYEAGDFYSGTRKEFVSNITFR